MLFSASETGAIVVADNNMVLDINQVGCSLLGMGDDVRGQWLEKVAPFLCRSEDEPVYEATGFDRYVKPCGVLQFPELPPGSRMITFRDASPDIHFELVKNVLNHVSESITIWDDQGRMLMLNDAAVKLEGHTAESVIGKYSAELFQTQNNSILAIPHILRNKKPELNMRQDYITETGKELQILSNNYLILKEGSTLGAVSIMEDYTKMDEMSRQIIDLQRKLMNQSKLPVASKEKENILSARYSFSDIIYTSESMREVVQRCRQAAQSDSPVMLYGETGCGKELFAQSIHTGSARANRPFLAVNCAAIPTTLMEAMLFGTEKGAYTGAEKREGLFEQAHTGTLLLDEINSMDIQLQSKLLRVLQEGTFRRVGGSKLIHADVRVISNINMPPLETVEQGLLRQDLYYRLGVINISIPPLRERKEDIALLCRSFIMTFNEKLGKNVTSLSPAAEELLKMHSWPGNVRELRHAMEYALNMIPAEQDVLTTRYLPDNIVKAVCGTTKWDMDEQKTMTLEDTVQQAGQRYLQQILAEHGGNVSQTAKAMGISRQNLQYRMKKYHVKGKEEPEGENLHGSESGA